MLREIKDTRQVPGETPRRWFTDEATDLIVWFDANDAITGFQLCYDKPFAEHALTWRQDTGFLHDRVDDGEGKPGSYKGTPILVPDGQFNPAYITEKFSRAAQLLDKRIVDFILRKLQENP